MLRFASTPLLLAALTVRTASAGAVNLSGTVSNPDGSGRSGVTVSLTGATPLTTTTRGDGTWSLSGATGVAEVRTRPASQGSSLAIRDGHLGISFGGIDVAGRSVAGRWGRNPSAIPAARALAVPDTLLYATADGVFLRDTLTNLEQPALVRVFDTTWNPRLVGGYLADSRDGRTYRTIGIGAQVWMAENLAWAGPDSSYGICPDSSADSCAKYGRLYTFSLAVGAFQSSTANPSGIQGICPTGWHVPSDTEWTILLETVDSPDSLDGRALKAVRGWGAGAGGDDPWGFRALPAGMVFGSGSFSKVGTLAEFWSATANNFYGIYRSVSASASTVTKGLSAPSNSASVRCVRDPL